MALVLTILVACKLFMDVYNMYGLLFIFVFVIQHGASLYNMVQLLNTIRRLKEPGP